MSLLACDATLSFATALSVCLGKTRTAVERAKRTSLTIASKRQRTNAQLDGRHERRQALLIRQQRPHPLLLSLPGGARLEAEQPVCRPLSL
jgi:hypothetical protein